MIDDSFDVELEARLRVTLDEMILKLVASVPAVSEPGLRAPADVIVADRATRVRGSRRLVGAVLAGAATILGLIAIAGRDTGQVTPGEGSAKSDVTPTTETVQAVTTTSDSPAVPGAPTTVAPCDQSDASPKTLIVNASHDNGTATWWRGRVGSERAKL